MSVFKKTAAISSLALIALLGCQSEKPNTDLKPQTEPISQTQDVPRTATKNAYFGDLHIHTKNSFDAYIFGTRATPDDAYRFAKGQTIDNGAGHPISLSGPPLDFLAVTDHGEYLGVVPALADTNSPLSKTKTAKSIFGLTAGDRAKRRENFLRIGATVVSGEEIEEIYDRDHMNGVWADTVAAAERHNAPGSFTTFAGYEFTAMVQVQDLSAANLHRNVIFKDAAPRQLFTTLDSPNPEDLWVWMDAQRDSGIEVLAIPHNSNASNGMMFSDAAYDGTTLPDGYAATRQRNEPLVEITQVKGTSEVHPALSPNDEWANFEQYEYLIGSTDKSTPLTGSFVRNALARGLGMKNNPYEFGFIGSSDTHLAAGSFSEEDHFGKFPHDMNPDNRKSVPPEGAKVWPTNVEVKPDLISTPQYGASGLAGVWAEANTRDDIYAAMQARETFGTSGPRILIRFFSGDDFTPEMLDQGDMIEQAYARGAPMGSKIAAGESAPSFLIWAMQDPGSAPLQRAQIIKVTAKGETVIDVACSDGSSPVAGRCQNETGAVDLSTCTLSGSGASELKTIWQDPNWQAGQRASYYVRVLENPKCRWSTWDAVRNGTPPNPEMNASLQDRAWSSPIWIE